MPKERGSHPVLEFRLVAAMIFVLLASVVIWTKGCDAGTEVFTARLPSTLGQMEVRAKAGSEFVHVRYDKDTEQYILAGICSTSNKPTAAFYFQFTLEGGSIFGYGTNDLKYIGTMRLGESTFVHVFQIMTQPIIKDSELESPGSP